MRHSSRWLIGMTASLVSSSAPPGLWPTAWKSRATAPTVSGIGVISGWKCEAEGDITVSFDGEPRFPCYTGAHGAIRAGRVIMMMGSTALWPSGTGGSWLMGNIPPSSMTMTWSFQQHVYRGDLWRDLCERCG